MALLLSLPIVLPTKCEGVLIDLDTAMKAFVNKRSFSIVKSKKKNTSMLYGSQSLIFDLLIFLIHYSQSII